MISNLKIITTAFLLTLVLPYCVYSKELQQQYNISVNKVWNIKFNTELDFQTLHNNITVTDTNGKLFDYSLELSNDCKTVTITPKVQYAPNKIYIITINKNIKSLKGSSIPENITKAFSTQSDEEILAHLPPSDWNPFIATDEELEYYSYPSRPKDDKQLEEWKKDISGGWYDLESKTFPMHSHVFIPSRIVWNKQVYDVDIRCGPINGEKIGRDDNSMDVYKIPQVNSSYGIVLGFGDKDGHRCTKVNYNANDALSMLFSDVNLISGKVGDLQFPQSANTVKTFVTPKNSDIKIPVELETKVDESEKPTYIITLTETWNTKDYSSNGENKSTESHYWRFKVEPNQYDDLDQGGDNPPQNN